MLRRYLLALCATLLLGASVAGGTASAQESEAIDAEDQATTPMGDAETSYEDIALGSALRTADLLDEWIAAGSVAPETSLIEVYGSTDYLLARADLIRDVDQFSSVAESSILRASRLDSIETEVDALQVAALMLRHDMMTSSRETSVTSSGLQRDIARVSTPVGERRRGWSSFAFDPTSLAERKLLDVGSEIETIIDEVERTGLPAGKDANPLVNRLTELTVELKDVRLLVGLGRRSGLFEDFEVAALRAEVVATMPDLHAKRLLESTSVGGLPLVTVDAYVQGAATLDAACPVEWNLLAGIARVESFHGTLGGISVQSNGRLTESILGPLLDGGATEREAAEAKQAAAVEAALMAVEAQAEADAVAEVAVTFDPTVWGEEALDRIDELAEETRGSGPVGIAAPAPQEPEIVKPRYDPVLWGDDLPFTDEELAALNAGDDVADEDPDAEEVPEFRGNGFAVIRDSDNGRLDGNARWDRAVGPMQFIPETWAYWETDGNGDGVIDPQNLYDSAASAGRFLCHLSRTRGASPYSFVLGYNSSSTYVRNVMAHANGYGSKSLPALN